MSDEIYTTKLSAPQPKYQITFHKDGERIGTLDFNGPQMVFTGDADESAKVFIEFVAERWEHRLKKEREAEREACARVCDAKVDAEYATGKVDHNEMGWTQACAIEIRARDVMANHAETSGSPIRCSECGGSLPVSYDETRTGECACAAVPSPPWHQWDGQRWAYVGPTNNLPPDDVQKMDTIDDWIISHAQQTRKLWDAQKRIAELEAAIRRRGEK